LKSSRIHIVLVLAILVTVASTPTSHADLSAAREVAYRIAAKLRVRGFQLFPGDNGDNSKEVQTFEFPVTKGVDYAFLVASDVATTSQDVKSRAFNFNIDLYIEDEFGTQIVADQRPETDAFVQFTSQFNGTAKAKLVLSSDTTSRGKGYRRFFFLMGQRGNEPLNP
jgi:hypothetical protein